jgi:glutamyl-tRNA synthetase
LRKRGIQPEAIRKFIIGMGLSLADVSVPMEMLYAENRKIIDSKANRYFAVLYPVEISVDGMKIKDVKAPLHPDFPKRGDKKIPVRPEKIYIELDDFEKHRGEEAGLMNLSTIKLDKNSKFVSKNVKMEVQKMQWVSEPNVKLKIIMPDGSIKKAIAEPEIKNVKVGELIQLPRIGFCRCDENKNDIVLYFAHK